MNPKVNYRIHKRPPPVPILSQINTVCSSQSNLMKIHFNIILLSTPGSNKWSLLFRSSHKNTECTSPVSCTCHMPSSSHSSWFCHPKSAWCGAQILKLLVMQSSPLPCYLVPLRSKYLPQKFSLEHPQLTFLPQCERPSFTLIQNNREKYSYCTITAISVKMVICPSL